MVEVTPEWQDYFSRILYGNVDPGITQAMEENGLDISTRNGLVSTTIDVMSSVVGVPTDETMSGVSFGFGSVPDPPNRYALLIGGCPQSGDIPDLFWNDLRDTYDLLLDRGFPSQNVRMTSCVHEDDDRVDASSTRQNIIDQLSFLGGEMDNTVDNLFYLTVDAHGCAVQFPCAFDGFLIVESNDDDGEYPWQGFANDLKDAIGFDSTAKYEAAVFVIFTSAAGAAIPYLSEDGGIQDNKRIIFTSSTSDETSYSCVTKLLDRCTFWTNGIFMVNYLNQLGYRVGTAFWWGFTSGIYAMLLPAIVGSFGWGLIKTPWPGNLPIKPRLLTFGGAFAAAWATALFYAVMFMIEFALILGIIAMAGLAWIDTKGSWVSGLDDITVWDAFLYARGWTEWGLGWWFIGTSHPQFFNEALADDVDLGP
jgi:hypothetical protein